MIFVKPISFQNNKRQTLRGFIHEPRKYTTAVIVLHGFPGHCEGSVPSRLALTLAIKGYLTLHFNFSGSDTSEGKFGDKLISQEVKEIKSAIDFLERTYHFKRLVIIGHSTGAIDAALYAHTDERISKLVLLGAVSKLNEAVRYDFTDKQVRDFWMNGYVVYKNKDPVGKKWWADGKKLRKTFYDEFFTLNIPAAIKKYKKPLLIVHGEKDEAIPVGKDPHELFQMANKPKKLAIINGADHKFTNEKYFKELVKVIVEFCEKK